MGGGGSRYAVQPVTEILSPCDWLLPSSECLRGDSLRQDGFKLKVVIGKGKFGLVYTAELASTNKYVAIKYISKEIIYETKALQRIQQEIDILQVIPHPFIVHCFGAFETDTCFGLVFDYAAGGELFSRIRKETKFKEPVAMFYFCELTSALGYMHDQHIVYRDLKPENILIDNDGHIKICDFGFAVELESAKGTLSDGCGSAMYVAPEIAGSMMKKAHGLPVDWWSLGCILFEMVTGEAPFGDIESLSKFAIFNNINGKEASLPMSCSTPLKEVVRGLLCKDAGRRWARAEVVRSSWLAGINWKLVFAKKYAPPWVPPGRSKYNTAQYLDWPKHSLDSLKIPSAAESSYCSGLVLPRAGGSSAKSAVAVGGPPKKGPRLSQVKKRLSASSPDLRQFTVGESGAGEASKFQELKSSAKAGGSRKSINKTHAHSVSTEEPMKSELPSRKQSMKKNRDAGEQKARKSLPIAKRSPRHGQTSQAH